MIASGTIQCTAVVAAEMPVWLTSESIIYIYREREREREERRERGEERRGEERRGEERSENVV
jgi:hypothetical protein